MLYVQNELKDVKILLVDLKADNESLMVSKDNHSNIM